MSNRVALAAALVLAAFTGRSALGDIGAGDGGDAGQPGVTAGAAPTTFGPAIDPGSLPAGARAWPRACSWRNPICVHAAPGTDPAMTMATLAAADRAWDALTGPLAVPAPDGDADGAWDVFLVRGAAGLSAGAHSRALLLGTDPLARFDRASSFALVDRATPPGCALDFALARAVARGSLWRAAPGTDEGSARAEAEALAGLATPCADADHEDSVRAFQSHPERAIVDPSSAAFDRGASLFFGWLDATFGARPGALIVGLWALSPTSTPSGAWRWAGSPTGFDVLRVSLKGALWRDSTLDDVIVRFAAVRAVMTPPPALSWQIPWPARARRLAAPEPVAPTGASYVAIDHAGAPPGAKLRLEAAWEDYARMRFIVLKLDASGKTLAELPIASAGGVTHASLTVEGLDDVSRVLVIGVNVGSTERPFDPNQTAGAAAGDPADRGKWEPHGWLLTVAAG